MDLTDWIEQFSAPDVVWYVKRLSANDTQANGSHQAGPHVSKSFLFRMFPEINTIEVKNPDVRFPFFTYPGCETLEVRAIYYNNKFHDNPESGRNEARVTGFGGAKSPLLDPENTGAIVALAFVLDARERAESCHAWVCRSPDEEALLEEQLGPIEPGRATIWPPDQSSLLLPRGSILRPRCALKEKQMPPAWLLKFPSGDELARKAIELRRDSKLGVDARLIARRDCEYQIFLSVERVLEMPKIAAGFGSIDQFVALAHSILQRRKSRAGRSLELHARHIFIEEGLSEGVDFSAQPESEPKKKPDFLFPSEAAYKDSSFPQDKLRMLAVKTTCKDRWRQIVKEADRVGTKHLLTLQEGVSENQFREMVEADVQLVVPKRLIQSYPESVRPHLQTLAGFIDEVRGLAAGDPA